MILKNCTGWASLLAALLTLAMAPYVASALAQTPPLARTDTPLTGDFMVNAPVTPAQARAALQLAKLPLAFIENRGQWDAPARFSAQKGAMAAAFEPDAIRLLIGRDKPLALGLVFEGASKDVTLVGESQRSGHYNYFIGNDPKKWQSQVAAYDSVLYRGLYEGIDLRVREEAGRIEYDLLLAPGADLAQVVIRAEGASKLELAGDGSLILSTAGGSLTHTAPKTWEELPTGEKRLLASRVRKLDAQHFGFDVPDRDPTLALVIDPGLEWSTLLGGASHESAAGIAVDAAGNTYVVGVTQSLNFPTTAGAFDRTPGDSINGPDVFVSKLNSSGTALVYSTYLGGGGFDFGRAIAIDAAGNAYVTGKTQSANFPTTAGAFDRTANIPATPRPQVIDDGFVTKLNAAGSALVYSTYLGGTDNDELRAIAIDAAGNAYITGETTSADFPTTAGAFDTVRGGEYDVFVTKLNAGGSALVYSTFLGGLVSDIANGIRVDPGNNAFVAGSTRSADFPTTPGAFDTTHNGGFDAFVTRLNATGSALVYSTFLGGTDFDDGAALAIDAGGNAFVAGSTVSTDFPTTPGAFDVALDSGSGDAFVAKLNAAGSALVYSTFLGGTRGEGVLAIAVDAAGTVWATGATSSEDFPITLDGFDISFNGISDVFVTGLNSAGSALVYSTLLGGASSDIPRSLALDAAGNVYVAGETRSPEFPTTAGAFDRVWNGDPLVLWGDGFIAKFAVAIGSPSWPGPTLAALSVSPASVVSGSAATGTVTLSSAALVGGAVVSLTDDSSVTTVPAGVTVPAGSTSATFAVTTSAAPEFGTTVAIVGTLGTSRSATLTVLPPAALLSGVSVNPVSVVGGNPSTATVTLSAAQSGPTVITTDPLPPTAPASVPASVTVPAGATSASFTISTTAVTTTFNLTIGVRLQGADSPGPTALLLIAPATSTNATLASLSLSANSVVGGSFLTGTVALSAAAPSGGAVVTLSDNSTAATTPSSVTVPAGATSTTFILTSTSVVADTSVILTATFNGMSRTLTLTVTAPPPPATAALSAVSVNPASVVGGTSSVGTVTLSAAAPSGGAAVSLSDDSGAASVPASVTVPAGATSAMFTVTTSTVTASTTATISAVFAGVTRTAALTVNPSAPPTPAAPTLVSPAADATPVQPVTFDWSDVANATSYEIQVDDSSTIAAPFRANQIVGVSQATIGGLPAQRLWWRVRAQNSAGVFGPFSATRRFTPQATAAAASLSAVSVNPTSVVGGNTSTGTATLTAAAPSGGAVVTLASSNPAAASVPASVTVAAGATSASFTVTTTSVTALTPVTVSAVFAGVTRTAALTVTPPGANVTLTVSASGRSGERVTSSPAGINVTVGSSGSASFATGTAITLSATNGRDTIWSGACSSGGNKTKTCTFTINGNASVSANVQ